MEPQATNDPDGVPASAAIPSPLGGQVHRLSNGYRNSTQSFQQERLRDARDDLPKLVMYHSPR